MFYPHLEVAQNILKKKVMLTQFVSVKDEGTL